MILNFNDFNNVFFKEENKKKVKIITQIILKRFKIQNNYILDVNIINNCKIRELNKIYRQINKSTDVLSFAFLDSKELKNNVENCKIPKIFGEIDISFDKVKKQAKENKTSIFYEFCYLYIHAFLHLLGFDHLKKQDAKIMFNQQNKILKEINYVFKKI